jgi:threonylcarbamoyladenosine tRNA methylthiotransferase MtaB
MKIAIYTLGCKVNQYETQAMEQELTRRGHTLVPFESAADAYIINTCTVTAVSDKKSRQMIRRARKENDNAVVAVCGCYAQTKPEEVAALDVDLVSGTGDRMHSTAPMMFALA